MSSISQRAIRARKLILERKFGVLATHSVAMPGYPFGSVVPFCLDRAGYPVILISDLAQHTKNIIADPKLSLTVIEDETPQGQAHGRVTYLAKATAVEDHDEDTRQRYYDYFPSTRYYHKTLDFRFYRLVATRVRFIGGFGDINWIEPTDFTHANPFSRTQENDIKDHMNLDHQRAMRMYCRVYCGIDVDVSESVTMVGIDADGFDLCFQEKLLRLNFEKPVSTLIQARGALVEMAKH